MTENVFGVTFRLTNQEPWAHQYVSIIDCRGEKAFRSYYTKWHEVAHLLVLTDQTRLAFRRTGCRADQRDPEEAVMDVIAGRFGFYPPFIASKVTGEISFDYIEELHSKLCPEASQQASLIGFVNAWPSPCLLVQAEKALRKSEQALVDQPAFDFRDPPLAVLRAVRVAGNDAAREGGLTIFPNMRVPERSIIHRAFEERLDEAEADEELSWWEASDGTRLPVQEVRVKARFSWAGVEALVIPH